ncbi:MAG: hypothetical protein ACRD3B_11405 [Candidatus Sulfotelmatobacter sp.]
MLAEDCREFLQFVHQRDPVLVIEKISKTEIIQEVEQPWERGEHYYLWNQAVLPTLTRELVQLEQDASSVYGIDYTLQLIEFWYASPVPEPWNDRPALTQGRVWASFHNPTAEFEAWYNAIVRWIRKNFVRDTVAGDYIGPAAYEWFKDGGLLLPHFRPPVTSSWLSWVEAQDQHRAVFST